MKWIIPLVLLLQFFPGLIRGQADSAGPGGIRVSFLPHKKKPTPGRHVETFIQISHSGREEFSGSLVLDIRDSSNKPVDGWFRNIFPVQYFTIEPGKDQKILFPMDVPHDFEGPVRMVIGAYDLKGISIARKEKVFLVTKKKTNEK